MVSTSRSEDRRGRRVARLIGGTTVAAGLLVGIVALTAPHALGRRRYTPKPADAQAPSDPRYRSALKAGLAGDLIHGEAAMLRLASAERGTSTAAWALYQAGVAERAQHHAAAGEALFARLRREYPGHLLALRTASSPAPPPARPRAALADCGPRALLTLCRQAKIPATLAELRKRCGTTADGTTLEGLAKAAKEKGLRVEALQVDDWFLRRHRPSGIGWTDGDHYVAFTPGRSAGEVSLFDPNERVAHPATVEELIRRSQGIVLLVAWGKQPLPEVTAPGTAKEVQ